MRRRSIHLAAAVLLVAGLGGCRQDMHNQPKFRAFAHNAFFEDQRASRPLVAGVVARDHLNEDAAFFQHDGVDRRELQKALADAWEKGELGRGASTVTMQLAKNLWLSTDRSLLRKLKELLLTRRLEDALPKKRILTLYLNVAEWGDGVYGMEAAAREHHGLD